MSNFYHDTSYSPAAEAALEEPAVSTASAKTITHEAPVAANQRSQSYALFHYALVIYIFLFCTRLPELIPQIRLALAMSVIMVARSVRDRTRRRFIQDQAGARPHRIHRVDGHLYSHQRLDRRKR